MVLQDLDISARFLPVIRAFLWDFIGCSALANSKREDMSYAQARARARALSVAYACVLLWQARRRQQVLEYSLLFAALFLIIPAIAVGIWAAQRK